MVKIVPYIKNHLVKSTLSNAWSEEEVIAAVADYFAMLKQELKGVHFNKSEHRRTLKPKLSNRSDGSIELKHQNISAVLIENNMPWICGYKPRANYQRNLLPKVVNDYLNRNRDLLLLFAQDADFTPDVMTNHNLLRSLESPPSPNEVCNSVAESRNHFSAATQINYLEREAQNLALGDAGEAFVIEYEKQRLQSIGKANLADKIEHVAVTEGPSAGFDILSFEENGTDRYIEVKTTKYGKSSPFFVTSNELTFSNNNIPRYNLYRVFEFRTTPKLYTLQGSVEQHFSLKPTLFKALPL